MLRKDLIELLIKYHLTPRQFIIKTNDIRFWKGKVDRIPKSPKPTINHKSDGLICDCGHRMSAHTLLGYCNICKNECINER